MAVQNGTKTNSVSYFLINIKLLYGSHLDPCHERSRYEVRVQILVAKGITRVLLSIGTDYMCMIYIYIYIYDYICIYIIIYMYILELHSPLTNSSGSSIRAGELSSS